MTSRLSSPYSCCCYFSSSSSSNNNNDKNNSSDSSIESNSASSITGITDNTGNPSTMAADQQLRRILDRTIAREKLPRLVVEEEDGVVVVADPRFAVPEDPFGLLFNDGPDKLGPVLPPVYERDSITGRLITEERDALTEGTPTTTDSVVTTMKQQEQLSDQEKHILSMDSIERDTRLLESIQRHWHESSKMATSGKESDPASSTDATAAKETVTTTLMEMGERIRTTDIATNVLGRSVHGQRTKEVLDDGTEVISRDTEHNFSQPLTIEEYHAFEKYMKLKHDTNISVDDIPVSTHQKPNPIPAAEQLRQQRMAFSKPDPTTTTTPIPVHPDEEELSLKWLTSRAQRQMDDTKDDNPFSDLMPGDLSPSRVVNRKHAKIIPTKLLHYNHMSLLQHFIGPTGQIMNRSQTRLGARDQRRISRLIKRSRALGLIPYMGQFKIENHGWVHTKDIHTNRKWENQIEQRGLVIQPSSLVSSSLLSSSPPRRQQQQQLSYGSNPSTVASPNPTPSSSSAAASSSSITPPLGVLPDEF
jgi:small subunit ribosomal protein S18